MAPGRVAQPLQQGGKPQVRIRLVGSAARIAAQWLAASSSSPSCSLAAPPARANRCCEDVRAALRRDLRAPCCRSGLQEHARQLDLRLGAMREAFDGAAQDVFGISPKPAKASSRGDINRFRNCRSRISGIAIMRGVRLPARHARALQRPVRGSSRGVARCAAALLEAIEVQTKHATETSTEITPS
jgi:membrane-bound lytic murein transglycosylase B